MSLLSLEVKYSSLNQRELEYVFMRYYHLEKLSVIQKIRLLLLLNFIILNARGFTSSRHCLSMRRYTKII